MISTQVGQEKDWVQSQVTIIVIMGCSRLGLGVNKVQNTCAVKKYGQKETTALVDLAHGPPPVDIVLIQTLVFLNVTDMTC